jgi:hypothetical protein
VGIAREALETLEVDEFGLDEIDRELVTTSSSASAAARSASAHCRCRSPKTVAREAAWPARSDLR